MRLNHLIFVIVGCLSINAGTALAQDDLIDDLPKEKKEAAAKKAATTQPKAGIPFDDKPRLPQPNTDLIDDLSPEQKQAAAERSAARKTGNAIPENLGDALTLALRNSPMILVAEAKVRQAQAELNEVRLSVTHDMTVAFQRRADNKSLFDKINAGGSAISGADVKKLRQAILEDEARIIYLLGVGSEQGQHADASQASAQSHDNRAGAKSGKPLDEPEKPETTQGQLPRLKGLVLKAAGPKPWPELSEKMRSFLDERVDFEFVEQSLSDVLTYLTTRTEDTPSGHVNFVSQHDLKETAVSLTLKQITVEAGLQALADLHNYAFVFRDYGILVVEAPEDIESYRAAGTPMIAPASSFPRALGMGGGGMGGGMMGGMMSGPGGMMSGGMMGGPPAKAPAASKSKKSKAKE